MLSQNTQMWLIGKSKQKNVDNNYDFNSISESDILTI